MATRKKRRFVLGSNKYKHKPISNKLINKVKRIQKKIEDDNNLPKGSVSFVWVTDNIDVRFKK